MRLKVGLNVASVRAAVDALERYRESLPAKCDEFCRRMAEEGCEVAIATVRKDTGALASSIRVERQGQAAYLLLADEEYAAFVEFGTGVVGQGSYQGELPAQWGYDERRTPEAHDPVDPTLWYYYDAEGRRRSTRGQTANGFMLAGSEAMRAAMLPVAREVFGRD